MYIRISPYPDLSTFPFPGVSLKASPDLLQKARADFASVQCVYRNIYTKMADRNEIFARLSHPHVFQNSRRLLRRSKL
jgi:hypothetical protein